MDHSKLQDPEHLCSPAEQSRGPQQQEGSPEQETCVSDMEQQGDCMDPADWDECVLLEDMLDADSDMD